jgi:ribonuclease BN (tRNA processing enzyme)
MKVIFLGVGEACDEALPNNSHLILSDTIFLLDCGYSAAVQLWRYNPDPSFLDAIYITHRHADHYFGIPALLVRMWEEKRTKPLTIICQRGLKNLTQELIEYGYQGLFNKLAFPIDFREVDEHQSITLNELKLGFATTRHSVKNLAIRVSDGENTICYSGDGMFNEETEELYKGADLVIHETYLSHQQTPGHASVDDVIDMAKRNHIKCLALTHLQRTLRKRLKTYLESKISQEKLKIIIPEPLEEYTF